MEKYNEGAIRTVEHLMTKLEMIHPTVIEMKRVYGEHEAEITLSAKIASKVPDTEAFASRILQKVAEGWESDCRMLRVRKTVSITFTVSEDEVIKVVEAGERDMSDIDKLLNKALKR